MNPRPVLLLVLLLSLAGCGATAPVPDYSYFRLPRPAPLPVVPRPELAGTLVVDAFGADGLYADQPLVYAVDPEARQLRQYHYQLWTDPPTRLLQRRLIAMLRDAGIATRVTDELATSQPAFRVRGVILRLDRVPAASGGYVAVVALKLRADAPDGTPLVDEYYRAEVAAEGAGLDATVAAYGRALDTLFARFAADLRTAGTAHAP
jgi:uncharacterized lipoprotein YmbA